MSVKPDTPITRKEMYLDAATGGSSTLPEPVTIEEKYLAKIAGMTVDLPAPVPLKHKFLAKIAGMQVDVPTYTAGLPQIYAYLAKAAGQDVEVPQPITREEMYWFDYVGGQPAPSEREYTGAVPVTFIADGTPLLDYLISGNEEHSGTPTPDSPVMPQGTGERTGNLFDSSSITLVPVSTSATRSGTNLGILPQGDYVFSATATVGATQLYRTIKNGDNYTFETIRELPYTFTADGTSEQIIRTSGSNFTSWASTGYTNIMLNTGSTALPYEPFGVKIPISSAGQTTPIYLGDVESTRRIKKIKASDISWIDGSSTSYNFYRGNLTIPKLAGGGISTLLSNKYRSAETRNNLLDGDIASYNLTTVETIVIRDDRYSSAADWLSANGDTEIWYVLATEETAVVNEPLMKIGDYADTLSMEQAGVSVPTVAGSNTLDVLTPVKPSEVYIKYNGEPVPQLSMLSSPSINAPEEPSEEAEEMPEEETPEDEVPEETEEETESITPETGEE